MQPVQPNSNSLLPTAPPSNNEAYCSSTTTIALAIITSLASFLCLPYKMAAGLSVIVLGAVAYYACSPKITETIKPPVQPQKQDIPAPISTPQRHVAYTPRTVPVMPALPAQQPQIVAQSVGPINIEIGDLKYMMCIFDTAESRKTFFNVSCQEQLDPVAHIILGMPEPKKVTFIAKHGYDVATILSKLFLQHPKEGRPTDITVKQNVVLCKFNTQSSVTTFLNSAIAKNLNKSGGLLTFSYDHPVIIMKCNLNFTPWDILSAIAKLLVNSDAPSS